MNFLTTAEISKKWKVSRRRVSELYNEGRVDGAILKGKIWLIPEGTNKPDDQKEFRKTCIAIKSMEVDDVYIKKQTAI